MLPGLLTLLEGRRRGWVKPNHKYKQRVRLADGSFKYVYSELPLRAITTATKKDDWLPVVARRLGATPMRDISINKRAATAIAVDDHDIVVVGADNLLGRKYVENKKFRPSAALSGKPAKGTGYKGVILGYKTEAGHRIADAYVYPVESVEDKLALEAQRFQDLPRRLKAVHDWADSVIAKRNSEDRQAALVIRLLRDSKQRIGGSGGSSIPKEVISDLQRRKREEGWSVSQYRDAVEEYRISTFGVVDLTPQHVNIDSGNGKTTLTMRFLGKAAKQQLSRVHFDETNSIDAAYIKELRTRVAHKKLFDISSKVVSQKYETLGQTTPHTERHAFARQQFVNCVLQRWKLTRRYKNKTAARQALREAFYKNISVPLGHENKNHNVTTALNSYVGLDMKLAFTGLLADIDSMYARKRRVSESAQSSDYIQALARLIKLAAVKHDLPDTAEDVVFV